MIRAMTKTKVLLTHDMRATGNGHWRCIDCGRAGTIHFINLVTCPATVVEPTRSSTRRSPNE